MQDAENPEWVRGEGVTPASSAMLHTKVTKCPCVFGCLQPPLDRVFHASRHRSRFAGHPESAGHRSRPAGRLCPHQGRHGCQTGDDMIQRRILWSDKLRLSDGAGRSQFPQKSYFHFPPLKLISQRAFQCLFEDKRSRFEVQR